MNLTRGLSFGRAHDEDGLAYRKGFPDVDDVLCVVGGAESSAFAERGLAWQGRAQPRAGLGLAAGTAVCDRSGEKLALPELINLAEEHNPVTRQAWETAKARADSLGIARSALYPTMSAVALAATTRDAALIGEYFHRQTIGLFEPVLHVDYLVFDLGGRSGTIDAAKANLLAADLAFNDTHRKLIFETASAYYRLLNAEGQRKAAEGASKMRRRSKRMRRND